MANHAGFAAAIVLGEPLLNSLIRVLHHANSLPHTLGADQALPVPGGTARLQTSLFLDVPKLACSAGTTLRMDLVGWGPWTITLPGLPPEARRVRFSASLTVVPSLTLAASKLTIGVEAFTANLTALSIDPYAGGPFSAPVQAFLATQTFHDLVQLAIRFQLASLTGLAPPVSLAFLGPIASAANTTVTPAVLSGALAIGLDINLGGVTTSGNAALLTDFRTATEDLAMVTHPSAASVAFPKVETSVRKAVEDQGATLDSFSMTMADHAFHIAGHATKSPGSVDFSMDAVSHLIRPGTHEEWDEEYGEHFEIDTPPREELWFEMTNVSVDVHRDWWVYLLEVLGGIITLGVGVAIVEAMVDSIRGNIVSGINQQSNTSQGARTQEFTLEGTTEPLVRLHIERFAIRVDGLTVGMTMKPQFSAASLSGWGTLEAELLPTAVLPFKLKLPFDAHPEDPELRVRWTLRRTDTGAIVTEINAQAGSARTFNADLRDPALMSCSDFRVDCRVFRTLGATATELFSDTAGLRITDRLDRTHPYVRWRHSPYTPNVKVEADGTHTQLGYNHPDRRSAIHRTAIPGRCRMASRYSPSMGPDGLEYLDALPFPTSELIAHRAVLCDYCFFGGPTKTVPLIPV